MIAAPIVLVAVIYLLCVGAERFRQRIKPKSNLLDQSSTLCASTHTSPVVVERKV